MDALLGVVVCLAIGGWILLTSGGVTQGWLAFCEDEWSLSLDRRAGVVLRSTLVFAGFLFILLGLASLWRG